MLDISLGIENYLAFRHSQVESIYYGKTPFKVRGLSISHQKVWLKMLGESRQISIEHKEIFSCFRIRISKRALVFFHFLFLHPSVPVGVFLQQAK